MTTRWADNDAYGHVNNTVYYEWFDSAVNAWMVEQGMLDIADGDPIALVVETRCTYAAPLAFPADGGCRTCGRASLADRASAIASASSRKAPTALPRKVNSSTWWSIAQLGVRSKFPPTGETKLEAIS